MSKITCIDVHGVARDFDSTDLKWRPSAYGIVIKDRKILLSPQFGDKYDLPGGGVDLKEKFQEAVVREVKEETGIDIKNPEFLGFKESFFWDSHFSQNAYHSLMFYYVCEYAGGELSTEGFDETEEQYAKMALWFPLEEIDDIKIASSVDYRPYIKKAIR